MLRGGRSDRLIDAGGRTSPSADDLAPLYFEPHSVSVVTRPEGYREFRCQPATWSYEGDRPLAPLLTEFYSSWVGADRHGTGEVSDFWSGSDAALRLRSLPPHDLALRELAALATRRLLGLNAPKPWASRPEIADLGTAWEPEATDIHFSQVPMEPEDAAGLWTAYGMERTYAAPVVFGYGMRESGHTTLAKGIRPWLGGRGTWYAWSTLRTWERWPRRQAAESSSAAAESGKLLLFVSHRWTAVDHPDPDGSQLLGLEVGLTLAVAAALLRLAGVEPGEATQSGMPELIAEFLDELDDPVATAPVLQAWAEQIREVSMRVDDEAAFCEEARALETRELASQLEALRSRILVWYDYASMFQAPRSADEERAFRGELLELNEIQRDAGTVVIAGDSQYLGRAWCFLELCGGIRGRIVELSPSWGSSVGVGASPTGWAAPGDQLIGALHAFGPEVIERSSLAVTDAEDLPDVANLLAGLPVTALIETDDSDLVGGVIPLPFRDGKWLFRERGGELAYGWKGTLSSLPDPGRLPETRSLRGTARLCAEADALGGETGILTYATQRALALAWASRAAEILQLLRVEAPREAGDWTATLESVGTEASVRCLWADARALADDGLGWTRAIPSTVSLLILVTQPDIPELCLIYELIVETHLAAGATVVTYMPETGDLHVHDNSSAGLAIARAADVLAVPRLRRADVYPRYLFTAPGATREDIEVLAALRLNPEDGFVGRGQVSQEAAAAGYGGEGEEITTEQLLSWSEARVRAEAIARGTAGTWDSWCRPRLTQSAWRVGIAPLQLHLIEQLVRKSWTVSDNPFLRRKLLEILVADDEGYALPPAILETADELIARIRQSEEEAAGTGGD
jgi:hypothetical protein